MSRTTTPHRKPGGAPKGNANAMRHGLRSAAYEKQVRDDHAFYQACRKTLKQMAEANVTVVTACDTACDKSVS